jgi:hypothetical protein
MKPKQQADAESRAALAGSIAAVRPPPRGRRGRAQTLPEKNAENCLTNRARFYLFVLWGKRSPHEASC